MAKFKEYSKRFLCILSVCVSLLVAVFYPFEQVRADVISICEGYDYGLYKVPGLYGSVSEYNASFSTTHMEEVGYSFKNSNGLDVSLSYDKFYFVAFRLNIYELFSGDSDFDFNKDLHIYLMYGGQRYEFSKLSDTSYTLNVFLSGADTRYFSILVEYTVSCDHFELYDDPELIFPVKYIYSIDFKELKLFLRELTDEDAVAGSYSSFYDKLNETNSLLADILKTLQDAFGATGENDEFDDVDDSEMGDYEDKEDDLFDDSSPDDLDDDISVTIDSDASAAIWDIINDFVQANSSVFGAFITLLSLGVIRLILNR